MTLFVHPVDAGAKYLSNHLEMIQLEIVEPLYRAAGNLSINGEHLGSSSDPTRSGEIQRYFLY